MKETSNSFLISIRYGLPIVAANLSAFG